MKLPNNYGSISKLSGNRRRPYMVRKSLDGKQLVIGYFETKEKALQALADYNRQPSELPKTSITLTTLYKQWLPHHAPNLSKSGVASYENSYRHIQSIAAIPIQNLTYDDFQGVLDAMQLSYASKKKVRSLINQLCKFAIKKDLMQRNFGDLVTIGKNSKVRPHKPFTRQQINAEIKTEETTLIYPIKLNTYLGAVVLSHDAYSSNSAKSIERLTTTKNGVRNDDLSTIVLRKVLVKDSSAYTAGGAHVFIFGI